MIPRLCASHVWFSLRVLLSVISFPDNDIYKYIYIFGSEEGRLLIYKNMSHFDFGPLLMSDFDLLLH